MAGRPPHLPVTHPPSLDRRDDEEDRHHRAFLLYGMQHPKKRSCRAVAKAMSASTSSLAEWCRKKDWMIRLDVGDAERHCALLYADLYHRRFGGKEVEPIVPNMHVMYTPPDEGAKTAVAREVDRHIAAETKRRDDRLGLIVDAAASRLAQGLAKGEIEVKVSDVQSIIKARNFIEGKQGPAISSATEDVGARITKSERVLAAEQAGDDPLPALIADVEELRLILTTMQTHDADSNVVPFPAGSKKPKAATTRGDDR